MVKVIIATILDNINTGTFLQALALGVSVEKLGYQPLLVDYNRPHLRFRYQINEVLNTSSKSLFRKSLSIANVILDHLLRRRLKRIVSNVIPLCKLEEIRSLEEISNDLIYMTGSDQVWNNEYNRGIDPVYYLQFAPPISKKVAYAASIGQNSLSILEKKAMCEVLKEYNHITVREDSAKIQLDELGYASSQVLDPTLLLSKEEWTSIFGRSNIKNVEPYLLVYSVEWNNNDRIMKLAKEIASRNQWKIYVYSTCWNSSKIECDRFFSFGTPDLFISLLDMAEFVLVSSFHGTAFSINFNKRFLAILPNKYSSRSYSILNKFNLLDRIYKEDSEYSECSDIDYSYVNEALNEERKYSMFKLAEILK